MNTAPLKDSSLRDIPTRFAFPAPAARRVSLAGDFNNWDPETMPMYKGTDGVWYLTVSLKPGRYEYRFILDGVWQHDPAAEQKTGNAVGGANYVKTVTGEITTTQAPRQLTASLKNE